MFGAGFSKDVIIIHHVILVSTESDYVRICKNNYNLKAFLIYPKNVVIMSFIYPFIKIYISLVIHTKLIPALV